MKNIIPFFLVCLISTVGWAQDSPTPDSDIHVIKLSKTADNDKYGLTPEQPIKVGKGPDGGPGNQRAYLEQLRDAKGKSVTYKRLGSCCPYPSKNGFLGSAMVDKYEVVYQNEKGKKKEIVIYISFYDYEEPMAVFGFTPAG